MSPRRFLRWLATSVVLVLVVSALTFVLTSLAPGDAARIVVGPEATQQTYGNVRAAMGLDRPVLVQYLNWLGGAVQGDLGTSLVSGAPITEVLRDRIEPTLALLLITFVISSALGIVLGVISASRGGAVGKAIDVLTLGGLAVPSFWIGLVLAAVFAVILGWFPAFGYQPMIDGFGGWAWLLVLPVATLVIGGMALLIKQTRDAVAEQLTQPYVVLLRSHGVSELAIVWRHALRNAAVPIATILGMKLIGLTSGTVLVETVFVIPGLGSEAVAAAKNHDLPIIQAVTVVFTIVVVVTNLLVEIAYGRFDVRGGTR